MSTARPFSDPISVRIAGLTLIALAAASFTSGLWRQLRLPRPDHTAKVVVISPQEALPAAPGEPLARMTPTAAAPSETAPRRRRAEPDLALAPAPPPAFDEPDEPDFAPEPTTGATADAAAIAPVAPMATAPMPPPEPAPPP